jgi:hypothetical protein
MACLWCRNQPGRCRCYRNVPTLPLGNDPLNYQDEVWLFEDGLSAAKEGAEGSLPRWQLLGLDVDNIGLALTIQGSAWMWERQPENLYPRLQQHQAHYDQHGSLGRVLTGEHVVRSPPKSRESKPGNETRTRSQRPLDIQL